MLLRPFCVITLISLFSEFCIVQNRYAIIMQEPSACNHIYNLQPISVNKLTVVIQYKRGDTLITRLDLQREIDWLLPLILW